MAAGDLFKRAARYRKQHPGMSMPEAVKACSKKSTRKKIAGPKKKAKKKPVKYAIRWENGKQVAVKIKPGRFGNVKHHKKPRKAAKKRTAAKKSAPRKIKTKIKIRKVKNGLNLGISGINHAELGRQLQQLSMWEYKLQHAKENLKQSVKEKDGHTTGHRRDIERFKRMITTTKRHITALKRSI